MKEMLPGRDLNGIAQTYLSSLLLPQAPIFHKKVVLTQTSLIGRLKMKRGDEIWLIFDGYI